MMSARSMVMANNKRKYGYVASFIWSLRDSLRQRGGQVFLLTQHLATAALSRPQLHVLGKVRAVPTGLEEVAFKHFA
ncbi:MAG TPA: hypothetical protein VFK06_25695 [Candidatus Angelobacter sp.]|nr:hypothetical protein [Candidatus Angelobacter sp.]